MSEQQTTPSGQELLQGWLFHLRELRTRLLWAFLGLAAATILSFIFAEQILLILMEPYGETLQTLRPTEGIETYFKIALLSGVIIAMPWIALQLWIFISEGLESNEKRYVYVFVPAATVLFLTGVAFAWFILIPTAISFLSTFLPDVFDTQWTSQEYISFVTGFIFWLGVAFQMPLIFYFLARLGIVTAKALRDQWRIAIVGVAVIAAIITPSIDPVTMLLTMTPLLILYLLSIVLAKVGQRQFDARMVADADE
ncbi:MAG: twin-arginine translocase subunit TatC [Anaerolineae bacterium]|nr:twin-arginine translocase subunit TatC [Anaerolineae bacterium]MCO5197788.1 twin-arginine translocase subunit TatC [Anaerolineae bacterium]